MKPLKFAIFDYPENFVTLPDYTAHAKQIVVVGRQLSAKEAERSPELERMFHIKAGDGWKGHAWESELLNVSDPRRRVRL